MQEFSVSVCQEAIDDVLHRLAATRWLAPTYREDLDAGASLGFARKLAEHWLDRFDWRELEARINRQPQVLAEIDGLAIHAIVRRSTRADAVPVILLHGWPSSFLEFLDVCDDLAAPPPGDPAFHVVVPSLPGYGFSTTREDMSPRRIAALLVELMDKLGYQKFLVQGANWGSTVGTQMARDFPGRLTGLHLNSVNASVPPPEAGVTLSPADQVLANRYVTLLSAPHFNLLSQSPLGIAHALNDSPAGLAAFLGERLRDWADPDLLGNPGLAFDWLVGTAALYWFTGSAGTAGMLYREAVRDPVPPGFVSVPTAVAHFAAELVMVPRPWAERHYNIVRWTNVDRGGHFAAVETPGAFVADLREFARMLG